VTEAADEAGGHGFVTEFASKAESLSERIWSSSEDLQWQSFRGSTFSSFPELFQNAVTRYGSLSGFWDVARRVVVLPSGIPFEDFKICPNCYAGEYEFSPSELLDGLESDVIAPMRDMQTLIDGRPYVTRLYTTLSASEMTKDPLFAFNPELEDVSNVHTAQRVLECGSGLSQLQAPWRIELVDGSVIRGAGVSPATPWPAPDQPSTRRILQIGESGSGRVAEDHSEEIAEINAPPPDTPTGGKSGANGTGGRAPIPLGGTVSTGGSRSAGTAGVSSPAPSDGGGCSIAARRGPSEGSFAAALATLAAAAAFVRRRTVRVNSRRGRKPRGTRG
jgi:hypothetical protein